MLAELHEERARIDEVIAVLERLASHHGRLRGRKPAWMKMAEIATKTPTGKKKLKETGQD